MRLTPKSEAEAAAASLLPAGTYDFEVVSAEETTSKAGNDMIKMGLRLFDASGNPSNGLLFDYLMEKVAYKLRHAACACGLLEDYEAGALNADDMVGKTGQVKIKVREPEEGSPYGPQNTVADYVVPKTDVSAKRNSAPRKPAMADADLDDEIPF